jgi:hypothetical protein
MPLYPGIASTTVAGSVILDGTASDIAATGVTAAAGSVGKAADAGHVHTGLSLVAATAAAGYSLVNGTGNIITWTAPNDGLLHRFGIFAALHVTVNETGGQITVAYTLPDGTATTHTLFAAGATAGDQPPAIPLMITAQANTAVTVKQATALTGGTSVMWAEIWAS